MYNIKLPKETVSANRDAAVKFHVCFKKIIRNIITMTTEFLTLMKLSFIGRKCCLELLSYK
jgi:hypothetical protein